MRLRQAALAAVLAAAALAAAAGAGAVEQRDIAEKRSDLDEVKRRISALQKAIAETEDSRGDAANAVAEAERAVSQAERRLRELAAERADTERNLASLEAEQQAVESRLAGRQTELAQWLRRQYMHGGAGGVASFLSARDPNQLARDAYYLERLGRAHLDLIETLRADLRRKASLAEEIAGRRDRLVALEGEQQAQRGRLAAMHDERQRVLAKLSAELSVRRKEVDGLRQDEERLGRVVAALVRAARRPPPPPKVAADTASAAHGRHAEPVVGEVKGVAGPTPTGVSFEHLRGHLRFPVRGELVGRFGAPRAGGGTTWKGVFIRAASGEEVRAVAAGEVVFSDWLRGYGNLVIIDHGGNYLSVYGNNDALYKQVGDAIAGGEPIASVGASGGAPESGLYFEIRYQGRPLDPLQWVTLK